MPKRVQLTRDSYINFVGREPDGDPPYYVSADFYTMRWKEMRELHRFNGNIDDVVSKLLRFNPWQLKEICRQVEGLQYVEPKVENKEEVTDEQIKQRVWF